MKITITDTDYTIKLKGDESLTPMLLLNMMLSVYTNVITEQGYDKESLEAIYDHANISFSNALTHIIPDAELRPDLDELAILELENNIIQAKLKETETETE